MRFTKIGQISEGQDGAIWGGFLFRFQGNGFCRAYDVATREKISEFFLDGLDAWMPHSNAVTFGCEYYEAGDEFPLLYTNVYNTYAQVADRREGACCVYRLTRQGTSFRGQLVQTIRIGFVKDPTLWCSEGCGDVRPYGNFVVDRENGIYYGFTMRDAANSTPYFAFKLPKLADGPEVVLQKEDILTSFETPYHRFLQGACVYRGKIFSVEGFTNDGVNPPAIRIIDPEKKEQLFFATTDRFGMTEEPELIDFWNDVCYCSDCKGNLFIIDEIEGI